MKKLVLLFVIFTFMTVSHVAAVMTPVTYSFTVTDGKGYNLTSGVYEDREYWASTSKMLINPATQNGEIEVDPATYNFIVFFDEFNRYMGFYDRPAAQSASMAAHARYLDSVTGMIFEFPEGAHSFALQTYDLTRYLDTIETLEGSGVTLYDAFGLSKFGTSSANLFPDGDVDDGSDMLSVSQARASSTDYAYSGDYSLKTTYEWTNRYEVSTNQVYYLSLYVYDVSGDTAAPRVYTDLSNILSVDEDVWSLYKDYWLESGFGTRYLMASDATGYIYYDYLMLFNLTDLYGVTTAGGADEVVPLFEESIDEFDDVITNQPAPLVTTYYDWLDLDGQGVGYSYDYVEQSYSLAGGIEDYLERLNMNTAFFRYMIGFGIMAVVAVGVGLWTRNPVITLVATAAAYVGITMIGWFPTWIMILIVILFLMYAGYNVFINAGGE